MRKALIAGVALLAACASASPPPGGAEDKLAPQLLRATPDTNAVNVTDKAVSFYFDETINDRGTGPQEVSQFFLVSPSDGAARVSWHRKRIDVRPRRDFRPNTAYTISLLPGLTDLQGNAMKAGAVIVFSTGPTIPRDRITGIAFDWVAERPLGLAYMEAVSADSVVYLAQADSSGRFTIGPISPGTYLVRAIADQNNNRSLDRSEAHDSARVTVPQVGRIELLTAPRDTLPARLQTVEYADSVTLRLTFDRHVDPAQPIAPSSLRLIGADSVVVPILAVLNARQERTADSLRLQASADSVRRADSVAGRPVVAPAPPARRLATDTTTPPPKPSQPPPFTTATLKLGRALASNTAYRLGVTGIRALSGRTQPSERSFTTPRPAPARPAADTTAAPPVTPPRTPPPRR